jgi:hypothetical protein
MGNISLAGIVANIGTLQQLSSAGFGPVTSATHRIMLIFSENPQVQTAANCKYLDEELTRTLGRPLTRGQNFELDSFRTYSDWHTVRDEDMEFWVVGVEVM